VIRLATLQDRRRWDDFILARDLCGPYQLFTWKDIVEQSYHHESYYLICEDQSENILGVLPLFFIKPPLLKGSLVSLPFCDYGGVLTVDEKTKTELITHAISIAANLKASLEIRCMEPHHAIQTSLEMGVMLHKMRMVLNLPDDVDSLWNGFKSKLRSQIRRPQKDGLEFRMGSLDLLKDFYNVFRINMRDLGSPVHSKFWIRSVMESFGNKGHIGVVYAGNSAVAAGVIITCSKTVSIPWASALSEYNQLSPNMLLYWEFLKYACSNGFKYFDFGRSSPGEGTYRFKEQWGARPHQLYWYYQGISGKQQVDTSEGSLRKTAEKIWERLPQGLVDVIGPMVRQYIYL
jgi:FemAB-related protein (PEP-CTERM system-associated)